MIKGIIFDFDGLILDTETHHYRILQEMFAEYGSELPIERWQQEIGTQTGFSPFHYLEELIEQEIEHKELQERLVEKFHVKLMEEKARDGVEDYLKAAKELGLKIGLASSSDYEWVSKYLKNLGLFDYFECIRTSDDVEKVKPDPALYVQAAECLGLRPEECVAFEDSANGAMAAKRADMGCVIVPNEVTCTMDFCEVEHRLSSMADMPLEELIDHLNGLKVSK
ncbi:HAD family hydrolase [Planococcus shenhongbingii]|uniref:HAD family hydrolase n=1 Tax=Planococcus shenhongbingii TaxID=3058398 RepID=UPI002613DA06|nr:HAD family hydrolase [Planococcus sp. N016]WKA58273.1 HAD family hydrolase [Planococcus sp. N016]